MKKNLIYLTLVFSLMVVSVFSLSGCGRDGIPTTTSMISTTNNPADPFWNLELNEDLLTWNSITEIDSYLLWINGVSVSITNHSYDLSGLETGHIYELKVEATDNGVPLYFSPKIFYVKNVTISQTVDLEYDKFSPGDLEIDVTTGVGELLYVLDSSHEEIIVEEESGYYFTENYLTEVSYGFHYFYFVFENAYVLVNLTIVDSREPELISSSVQAVNFEESAVFEFNLYDGVFIGLSGNKITSSDYSFEDGVLTIYSDYIEAIFEEDPLRENLILGYTIQVGPDIVVGYLFIQLNNTIVFTFPAP